MKIFDKSNLGNAFMTDVMNRPAYNVPTGEQPVLPPAGSDASSPMAGSGHLIDSAPLAVTAPENDASEGVGANPFADTDAILAKWGIAPTSQPVRVKSTPALAPAAPAEVRPPHVPRVAPVAVRAAVAAPRVVVPATKPKAEVVATAAEPELAAEPAAPVAELTEDDSHVVAEQFGADAPVHTELESEEPITRKAAFREALRQLKAEGNLSWLERRLFARRLAKRVVQASTVQGEVASPMAQPETEVLHPEGTLRSKATDLFLRAGVNFGLAQQAELRGPEYKGLKLVLGALGIVTVAAAGLYWTYKGIDNTVNATIPNLIPTDSAQQIDPLRATGR